MPDSSSAIIRVVIDINLLVRGTLSPTGGSALLIQALKHRLFLPITSRQHLQELYRVLGYPRLLRRYRITRRQRQRLVAQLYTRSIWVEPVDHLTLCRDPKDNYLLEMALLGRATHIVSEDDDLHNDPDIVDFLNQRGICLARLGEFLVTLRGGPVIPHGP
jgi:putative PIN family toxin of toxin-antitoxin system